MIYSIVIEKETKYPTPKKYVLQHYKKKSFAVDDHDFFGVFKGRSNN